MEFGGALQKDRPPHTQPLTHEVGGGLADGAAENEVLEQVGDEVERHAEEAEHEVADGQGQQEDVGDGPHPLVPNQHRDDQGVAQHAEQEDQGVQEDLHGRLPLCRGEQRGKRRDGGGESGMLKASHGKPALISP